MEGGEMELDIIVNPKTTDDGQAVIQVRDILHLLPTPGTWQVPATLARDCRWSGH